MLSGVVNDESDDTHDYSERCIPVALNEQLNSFARCIT